MSASKNQSVSNGNIFLRMHPLSRAIISLLFAIACWWLLQLNNCLTFIAALVISWIVFALVYLTMTWIVLFTRTIPDIKVHANNDDGSASYVFIMVLVASFASLISVVALMKDNYLEATGLYMPVSLGGMLLSWTLVHTLFTVHYAHIFYDNVESDGSKTKEGLAFPGNTKPDYIDFAYFAFGVGCAFQVSDVSVYSKRLRRLVLLHSLLSFILNTFVVALTINLIAGLLN